MKSPHGDRRIPDVLQIAAYLDGELEEQPHLVPLRRHIQEWLLEHPEAGAAALAQRRLDRLLRATQPREPAEAAWERMLARLEELPAAAAPAQRPRRFGYRVSLGAALLATAAVVWLALALWQRPAVPETPGQPQPPPEQVVDKPERPPAKAPPAVPRKLALEPFPVATADEIEIIRIGGADTKTLVVGNLPIQGPLLLAAPGEITLTQAQPEVRMDHGAAPIIWVRPAGDD